jgi:hypothetical protein
MVLQVWYSSVLERAGAGERVSTRHPPHCLPRLQGDGPTGTVQFCLREGRGRRESLQGTPLTVCHDYREMVLQVWYSSVPREGRGRRESLQGTPLTVCHDCKEMVLQVRYSSVPREGRGRRESLQGTPLTVCHDCKEMVLQVWYSSVPREGRGRRESLYKAPPSLSATTAGRWSYRYGTVLSQRGTGQEGESLQGTPLTGCHDCREMVLQVRYGSELERSEAGRGVSTGHPPHCVPRLQGDGPTGMVQFCPREGRGRRKNL